MQNETNTEKMMVSGRVIASVPKFITKNFGKDGLEKWLEAISPEAYAVYVQPIKDSDWHPLTEVLVKPIANIAQLFYSWDLKKAAWDMGRFAADSGINTVYKLFVRMGNASYFIKRAGDFMASAYKPSKLETGEITENSAIMRILEFPEIDKTTEYRMAGWAQRILEINGCKNVRLEIVKSLTNLNDNCTEFYVTWD